MGSGRNGGGVRDWQVVRGSRGKLGNGCGRGRGEKGGDGRGGDHGGGNLKSENNTVVCVKIW